MFSSGVYKENQTIHFLAAFFVFCVLVVLAGCTSTSQTTSQLSTNTNSLQEEHLAETTPNAELSLETDTPDPTEKGDVQPTQLITEPVIIPSPTPHSVTETETINATITPTFEPELENVTGDLFVYNPVGIQQVTLADGTSQSRLVVESEWLDWGASFAQNKKSLAYWIKTDLGTELWFTSLPKWQPQHVLQIENVAYDFATPLWGVNDRYLIFNLSVLDNSGPLEDIKTIRTYIIDMQTMELVNQSYWPGNCSILAVSPQTSELALWCYKLEEEEESVPEFLVLEPNESPWLTQETPDTLIDDCLTFLICAWSQDGELAAYIVSDEHPDLFFFTTVNNPLPIRLDDKSSKYYRFPVWSPDSLFLYYGGECIDAGECPNVMSVTNQEIIWRAKSRNNWGEESISVSRVVWSPDSRYLAIPILVETGTGIEEQVLFFNVMKQQEVLRIPGIGGAILDMVWVAG